MAAAAIWKNGGVGEGGSLFFYVYSGVVSILTMCWMHFWVEGFGGGYFILN